MTILASLSETTTKENNMKCLDRTALLKGRSAREKQAKAVEGIRDPDLKRPDLKARPARQAGL